MSDMNFFSSYNKKSEKKEIQKSTALINGFVILILAGIITYGTINILTIRRLGNEIAVLAASLETGRKDSRLPDIIAKEGEVTALKAELSKLYALDNVINDRDIVNEKVLEAIRVNTPPDLFLKSVAMSLEAIKLEGKSKDKGSIAQFAHNLRQLDGLERAFVPRVTDEKGYYSFYMDINLMDAELADNGIKEGLPDGAEAGKQ